MPEKMTFQPSAFTIWLRVVLMMQCFAAVSVPVFSQESQESRNVHLRNDCRLAVQTLQKGHPAPRTDWALSTISFCDESGGVALQALWTAPTTDSTALEQLVGASSRLLDQRVFDGARATLRNAGMPRSVRLAALRVLAAFLDNETQISPDHFLKPNPDTSLLIRFAKISGGIGQTVGSKPLPESASSDIRSLFAEFALADQDPVIRRACRSLQDWFIVR